MKCLLAVLLPLLYVASKLATSCPLASHICSVKYANHNAQQSPGGSKVYFSVTSSGLANINFIGSNLAYCRNHQGSIQGCSSHNLPATVINARFDGSQRAALAQFRGRRRQGSHYAANKWAQSKQLGSEARRQPDLKSASARLRRNLPAQRLLSYGPESITIRAASPLTTHCFRHPSSTPRARSTYPRKLTASNKSKLALDAKSQPSRLPATRRASRQWTLPSRIRLPSPP